MRWKIGLGILLSLVGMVRCVNEEVLLHPPGGRAFWTLKIRGDNLTSKQVPAMYMGESTYGIAYVALDSVVSKTRVRQILQELDQKIAPKEHALFTQPLDIDNNKKVILLFLDIDDGYTESGSYIGGYFDPLNQFDDASVQSVTGRRSNEAELIYLDTYPAEIESQEVLVTLAHEYQHLLQFSFNYRQDSEEEQWVDEGLSEIASDVTGYGPQTGRLIGFRTIGNTNTNIGDSLISWDGHVDDYNHVYMYFRYLVDGWGEEVASLIFRNPASGLAGIETALLQRAVPNQCGGYAAGYTPTYARFNCSYRFLWAAILGLTTLQGSTGTSSLLAHIVPAQLLAQHNPMNSLYPGDSGGITYLTNVPSGAQSSEPFSFTFIKNNDINGPPALSNNSCATCQAEHFSLLYNPSRFVVFNHHIYSAFSRTKIVDPRLAASIEVSGEEVVSQRASFSLSGSVAVPLEKRKKLHFYQKIPKNIRHFLLAPNPN